MVEFLCITGSTVLKTEWSLLIYLIEGDVPVFDMSSLPIDWDARVHSKSTQRLGRAWVENKSTSFIKIPSARIPSYAYNSEYNLLINPLHPHVMSDVKFIEAKTLNFQLDGWATGAKEVLES